MWRWATSFRSPPFSRVLLPVLALLVGAGAARAGVFLSVDEALGLAFPGCRIDHRTVYLTRDELARARELAEGPVPSALVHPYVATCGGRPGGIAYFDTHRVRTLPETLMVVVSPDGAVARLEVLAFQEPPDYKPRGAWYAQFLHRKLGSELELKRGIRPVTGATLTARATTAAVRRVLALDRVIRERSASPGSTGAGPREGPP